MDKKTKGIKIRSIDIKYNDNQDSRNKIIDFIIDCLVENKIFAGDENGNREESCN
jgi:hypothetical protein